MRTGCWALLISACGLPQLDFPPGVSDTDTLVLRVDDGTGDRFWVTTAEAGAMSPFTLERDRPITIEAFVYTVEPEKLGVDLASELAPAQNDDGWLLPMPKGAHRLESSGPPSNEDGWTGVDVDRTKLVGLRFADDCWPNGGCVDADGLCNRTCSIDPPEPNLGEIPSPDPVVVNQAYRPPDCTPPFPDVPPPAVYVSIAGNDANDGSPGRPLATISRALDEGPGTRIALGAGVLDAPGTLIDDVEIVGVCPGETTILGGITTVGATISNVRIEGGGGRAVTALDGTRISSAVLAGALPLEVAGATEVADVHLQGSTDAARVLADGALSARVVRVEGQVTITTGGTAAIQDGDLDQVVALGRLVLRRAQTGTIAVHETEAELEDVTVRGTLVTTMSRIWADRISVDAPGGGLDMRTSTGTVQNAWISGSEIGVFLQATSLNGSKWALDGRIAVRMTLTSTLHLTDSAIVGVKGVQLLDRSNLTLDRTSFTVVQSAIHATGRSIVEVRRSEVSGGSPVVEAGSDAVLDLEDASELAIDSVSLLSGGADVIRLENGEATIVDVVVQAAQGTCFSTLGGVAAIDRFKFSGCGAGLDMSGGEVRPANGVIEGAEVGVILPEGPAMKQVLQGLRFVNVDRIR